MSEEIIEENAVTSDIFNMSDEEIMNTDFSSLDQEQEEISSESEEDNNEEQEETNTEELEEQDNIEEEETLEANAEETEAIEETQQKDIDYKNLYESLFNPFKANGKEMKVDSIDEIKSLMQMGANYNKKMAALKPNLKILKMLEKNELLDENKLNYLIDLNKNNPEAISKLVKDSEIDPYSLNNDEDTVTEYTPTDYSVSEKEIELDRVLEEIQDTSTYDTTMNIVGNKWDEESRKILVDTPNLIKAINDHVKLGIYDQIANVIEKERMLGNLSGLSDIMAYKTIGDRLSAEGKLNTGTTPSKSNGNGSKPNNILKKQTEKLKNKRKAASPTNSSPSNSGSSESYNPLAMSDEEFEKVSNKFI